MFQRKFKRTHLQHLRELLWPSMGWRRTFHFTRHRILRLSATSHSIAKGMALGVSVAFSPLVGSHFVQIAVLGYFLRANLLAGFVSTFIGNPWTFPFMWWASIKFGAFLFRIFNLPASGTVPSQMDFGMFWHIVTHEPLRIFLPWMLGGYTIAVLIFPFTYALFYVLIDGAKKAKTQARLRRIKAIADEVTGRATP